MQKNKLIYYVGVLIGLFLIQTVVLHKFRGSSESIEIFTNMGIEPWGRYLIGTIELIAGILFLIPSLTSFAAVITAGIMLGAIGGHLGPIGISIGSSGPGLFIASMIIFTLSLVIIFANKKSLMDFLQKIKKSE